MPGAAGRLIEHGADPAAVDSMGNTALHAAVARNNGFLLRYLTELGVPDVANDAGLFYRDLFVGSCEISGRSSPVSNASLVAHLQDAVSWDLDVYIIDVIRSEGDDDDDEDESALMEDARMYMEDVHAWQGRPIDGWHELLSEPIAWTEPLAPGSEYSGIYIGSHSRLATSTLTFANPSATSCQANWTGSLNGELGIDQFALHFDLTFAGVTIDASSIDEAEEKLARCCNASAWVVTPERGRFRAVPKI